MEQNEITALTLPVIEQEIRAAYTEANALAVTAKGNARAAVLRMADCGQMLMVAKDHVRGNRNEWLASLGIDPDKVEFEIEMTIPSSIFELAQLEARNARADLAGRMVRLVHPWALAEPVGDGGAAPPGSGCRQGARRRSSTAGA
jgi:hypothetical protein